MQEELPILRRDVTPYEIAKYLNEVLAIEIAPQRVYQDRAKGRLNAYQDSANNNKWFVTVEDATAYIEKIRTGSSKRESAW